jgi:predicted O-methyltransferase YrrM
MSITQFLNSRGFNNFEGHCQLCPPQVADLINISNIPNINVLEIGFNAGHSAEIFLQNNNTLTLTSFDLGCHDYVLHAKQYIDSTFPNRHTLIIGDSRQTIPKYLDQNTNIKFDLIFIDGGHDYDIAKSDMENCFKLAHKDTIVVLDDTTYIPGYEAGWTIGPTRTWLEHVAQNKVVELCRKTYSPGHGMSWGKYVV